ncbi:S8 family peptidase [Lentzea sp. NPDC051213]|uniref:S8 family peptidase n=1 Tax=Lentzea sp. NPDC051213 TaxID=3364126 RepID=UPI0037AF96C7
MRIKICIAAALIATTLSTPSANAEKDVIGTGDAVADSYIVVLKDGVSASPQTLLNKYKGTLKRTYKAALNGFSVHDMSEKQARRLAADSTVAYVQRNLRTKIQQNQFNPVWGLDRIDQRALPLNNRYTYPDQAAAGVRAYVLDTGIRTTHQEFQGRASHGFDFVNDDPIADDCNGHGTHVAGTIAGRTFGVAKQARVIGVKVLGCNGFAVADSVVAGIDWITENGVRPAVVNMSLGAFGQNPGQEEAIRRSIRAGFTYVLAAGNDGIDACNFTPARLPEAITVAATDRFDARAVHARWQSNHGRCVDIWAPGADIQSASFNGDIATEIRGGTSMATPHVAGAAALHLGANPNATHQQVRDALVNGATTTANLRDLRIGSPDRLLRIGN